MAFFDALNGAQYAKAEALYGGSYEELAAVNPSIDPHERAALLENARTVNGYRRLKVKNLVQQTQTAQDSFAFTVEFMNADGGLFWRGQCCRATGTEMPLQSLCSGKPGSAGGGG